MEKNLRKLLDKVVAEEDSSIVYENIYRAQKLAKAISDQRRIAGQNKFYGDPLALIRVYADLLDVDKSKRVVVDKIHREKRNQPNLGEVQVTQATLLATILVSAFGLNKASENADIDPAYAESSRKALHQLKGAFKNPQLEADVIAIIQDTIRISEVNPGPVSEAVNGQFFGNAIKDEEDRVPFVLGSFRQLPGNASDGKIRPEAILIRVARRAAEMARMLADENAEYPADRKAYAKTAEKVHVPLAAEWRQHAHQNSDLALAATLDAAKAKMKDLILQIEDPAGYKKTYDLILETARELAPERIRGLVKDMQTANALVAGPMADEIHSWLPLGLQDICKVQGRIKSVYSTYYEIKKKGQENLRDLFGVCVIERTAPPLPGDKPADTEDKEHGAIAKLFGTLVVAIRKNGKYKFDINRNKNFYSKTSRDKILAEKNRDDNGYRTIQDGLIQKIFKFVAGEKIEKDIPIEIQVRSEKAHNDAEFGDASHDLYKNELKTRPGIANDNRVADEIPVFTDGNQTLAIRTRGTFADFLVARYRNAADPNMVFACPSDVAIYRPLHVIDPDLVKAPSQGFATTLMPCDRIRIEGKEDRNLIHDPEHRRGLIDACHFKESKNFLRALDNFLTASEVGPDRPGFNPEGPYPQTQRFN